MNLEVVSNFSSDGHPVRLRSLDGAREALFMGADEWDLLEMGRLVSTGASEDTAFDFVLDTTK